MFFTKTLISVYAKRSLAAGIVLLLVTISMVVGVWCARLGAEILGDDAMIDCIEALPAGQWERDVAVLFTDGTELPIARTVGPASPCGPAVLLSVAVVDGYEKSSQLVPTALSCLVELHYENGHRYEDLVAGLDLQLRICDVTWQCCLLSSATLLDRRAVPAGSSVSIFAFSYGKPTLIRSESGR